jgi:diacylglycerol O-acyltransferase
VGASQHLSSADAAWLHMDRPTNLMVINSVLRFDERIDPERLAGVVRARLIAPYPRFSQRVVERRPVLGGPRWEDDRDFDIARHLHLRGLPGAGDEAALKELVGDLASMPLDRDKPLWDMYLVDGPGRGCALIVRMHHCIADGIALAQVMLSLTDSAPGAGIQEEPPLPRGPARSGPMAVLARPVAELVRDAVAGTSGAIGTAARLAGTIAREGRQTLARPRRGFELAEGASADARALLKLLFTSGDAASVLKGELGTGRSVAWSRPLSLEKIKAIAHAQDATVNDVLLGAVSGALRGHLIACGEEPHEIRTFVPFNLRPFDKSIELGNRFGLVILTLPVDHASRRERLHELKQRMDAIKHSPEGPVSYAVLEALGLTPPALESRIVDVFSAKATAVMTNVPGPRQPVYLAGVQLRAVLVWAPTSGSVGMSVSIFSYNGEVTVGLLVHHQLVPDPQPIVVRLQRELAAMARLAPAVPA